MTKCSSLTWGLPECLASVTKTFDSDPGTDHIATLAKIEILYLQMLVCRLSHHCLHTDFWYWTHLSAKWKKKQQQRLPIKEPSLSCRWSLPAAWHRSCWQEVVIGPCWGFQPCPAAGKFLYNNCDIMVEMQNWSVHKGPIHATMLHLHLSCRLIWH